MTYEQAGAVAILLLFYLPAVVIFLLALRTSRALSSSGQAPRHERNGWLIAATVTLALGALAPLSLPLWTEMAPGSAPVALFALLGIALVPLAVLALAWVATRVAMFTLLIWALALPVLVGITGRWWLTESSVEGPNPQSVGLGTLGVILFITVPAMLSVVLLSGSVRAAQLHGALT